MAPSLTFPSLPTLLTECLLHCSLVTTIWFQVKTGGLLNHGTEASLKYCVQPGGYRQLVCTAEQLYSLTSRVLEMSTALVLWDGSIAKPSPKAVCGSLIVACISVVSDNPKQEEERFTSHRKTRGCWSL